MQDQPQELNPERAEKNWQRHGQVGTEHHWVQTKGIQFLLLPSGSWLCCEGLGHMPSLPVAGWTSGFASCLCLAPADPR